MKIFTSLILIFFLISFKIIANNIEILSDIQGKGLEIKNHYKVHVHYRGFLENGEEFDSSYKRNEPLIFQIGLRQVIDGWEKGLIGMRVGGQRKIQIPPNLAYGSKGAGKIVPPNSTLIFDILIIDAIKPGYIVMKSSELSYKKNGMILVDIRTKKDQNYTGIIEGSNEITAFDLAGNFKPNFINKLKEISNNKDKIIFISNSGDISSILANGFYEKLGYENIFSLEGGIQNWINEKRKLYKK